MILDGEISVTLLDGDLELVEVLDGETEQDLLDGDIELVSCFDGELSNNELIDGEPHEFMPMTSVPTYQGSYEYTPTQNQQTIEIQGLKAVQNIRINPIPQNYGLITWNGATLTVS